MLLLVAALAAANSYAPGILEAVLLLTALYLVAEHGAKVGDALTNGSAALSHAFGYSRPRV